MTSAPDNAYASTLPIGRTNSSILPETSLQPSRAVPMQVAQKESSSGFMLLSVKHQSRKKSDKYPCYSQAAAFERCLDDSCIVKSTQDMNHRGPRGNSYDYGRNQFTSTASLEAEEYDDEEDGTSSQSEANDSTSGVDIPSSDFRKSSVVSSHANLVQIAQAKRLGYINGHSNTPQSAGLSTPVLVSALPNDLVGQPILSDGSTISNNALLSNVRATMSTPGAPTSDCAPVSSDVQAIPQRDDSRCLAGRPSDFIFEEVGEPCMRQRLHPSVIEVDTPCNIKPPEPLSNDYQSFSNIPSNICVKSLVPNQKESPTSQDFVSQTLPITPPMQSAIQEPRVTTNESSRPLSDAQNGRSSIFSTLTSHLQPASRFRKTRIRETVEQWNSNRLSLHDCHLKAVPDWVSNLSTKPGVLSQNRPIVDQGRCVYCFIPSGVGIQCTKKQHQVSSRFPPASGGVTPNKDPPVNPALVSGILQAAAAAHQTCSIQGYNTGSLTSAWDNGVRVSCSIHPGYLGLPRGPLVGKHLKDKDSSESEPPATVAAIQRNEEDAVTGPSNPTSFTPGHQSSDLTEMLEGRSTATIHFGVVSTSTDTASAQSAEELENATQLRDTKGSDGKITDPSAAYLRRYATEVQQLQFSSDDQMCSRDTKDPTRVTFLGRASSLEPDHEVRPSIPHFNEDGHIAELAEKSNMCENQYAPPASPVGGSRTIQLPSTSTGTTGPAEQKSNEPLRFPYARIQPVLSEFLEKEGAPLLDIKKLLCKGDSLHGRSNLTQAVLASLATTSSSPTLPTNLGFPPTEAAVDTTEAGPSQELPQSRFRPRQDLELSGAAPKPQSSNGCDTVNGIQSGAQISGPSECGPSSMAPHSALPDRSSLPSAPTMPPEVNNRLSQDELQAKLSQQQQQQQGERVDSRILQNMDVIGIAIVNTFRNELVHLISENTDLRAQQQNLIFENLSLQCYQRAFQELQGYIPGDLWERFNTRVQLEIQQVLQAAVLDAQARNAPPVVSQFTQQPPPPPPQQSRASAQPHDQLSSILELLINLGQVGGGAQAPSAASALGLLQTRSQSPLQQQQQAPQQPQQQHPTTPIAQVLSGSSLASSVLPPATSCSQPTQVHLLSSAPSLPQVPEQQPYPQSPSAVAAASAAQIQLPISSAEFINPSLPTTSSPVHNQFIDPVALLTPTGTLPNPVSTAPAPPAEK